MHQSYLREDRTEDEYSTNFSGTCYLTDSLEETRHRTYTDLYSDDDILDTWKLAPSVGTNVIYFDIYPHNRFDDGYINENCNDGRYGNWDCGPGFYYRETAILVKLPRLSERISNQNKILALLVSYTQNDNLLFLLRTQLRDFFKMLLSIL